MAAQILFITAPGLSNHQVTIQVGNRALRVHGRFRPFALVSRTIDSSLFITEHSGNDYLMTARIYLNR
ncbi:MAG TPA: hypothetical protein VF074_03230, partial [Pyrinomonadaceae bacterium]